MPLPRAPRIAPLFFAALPVTPANLRIGTSGWAYPSWKPGFYPPKTSTRAMLAYYSSQLTAVEVNYTFRSPLAEEQVETWLNATPPDFRFSFKAPQHITHFQRLRDCHQVVADFTASLTAVAKAGKLGPVLFQLPPNFSVNLPLLVGLLSAPGLKLRGRRMQVALEFRHPSWFTEETYKVLRRFRAALCIAESEQLITPEVHTAPFLYYRLRCSGAYSSQKIGALAERFTAMCPAQEVFAYFKHEDEPTGALNAKTLLSHANRIAQNSSGAHG